MTKCQRHGVSAAEIEGLFTRPPTISADVEHTLAEERLKAIGKSRSGRSTFLVFTPRARWKNLHPAHQRPLHAPEGGRVL